ncbi:MAG: hypothetical protein U9Q08_02700 [Candidatus Omnitrophota bacterium]|nr:hypothetical protein [Candidatus Omnitrophota bacterium]
MDKIKIRKRLIAIIGVLLFLCFSVSPVMARNIREMTGRRALRAMPRSGNRYLKPVVTVKENENKTTLYKSTSKPVVGGVIGKMTQKVINIIYKVVGVIINKAKLVNGTNRPVVYTVTGDPEEGIVPSSHITGEELFDKDGNLVIVDERILISHYDDYIYRVPTGSGVPATLAVLAIHDYMRSDIVLYYLTDKREQIASDELGRKYKVKVGLNGGVSWQRWKGVWAKPINNSGIVVMTYKEGKCIDFKVLRKRKITK